MFIFKRAIKKNISTDEAEEILQKLNSFLDENSPQPTYWLTKIFKDQQNSITYAELEKAAAAGFENEIRKWQEDYAKFVNEKLNPLWLLAINAGAKHFSEKHKNIFYDSDRFVKDWLNKHAAEFITNINTETRQAIKSILAYAQDNGMSVKEIAKMIRPTIGLNARQAAANLNYQNKVKENFLKNNPRMSQAKAEQKAQAAALKYASKQHRQRAEMIAHTELAFAYNRGAHESVRQAMSNGLMGRCEKVWTTAGTNRVCGRCMDLSGTVVGFEDKFFNSSVTDGQTPPLHPRCRCVIVYREIDSLKERNSLQTGVINGNIRGVKEIYAEQIKSHGGSGNIRVDEVTDSHSGNPRKSKPLSIIDHKQSRDDKIDKRAFYDLSGLIYLEIHTTNHGNAKNHPFGKNGEHAHQIEWQDGKPKVSTGRELSDDERKDNGDIL